MNANNSPLILVADDQAMMRDGIVLMLQNAWPGCICKIASDYAGVVEQLENQNPHLPFSAIILDLRMPGMRGVESVNHITKLAAGVPVLVCTALEDPGLVERLMSCGIYQAVNKTSGADELLRHLHLALQMTVQPLNENKNSIHRNHSLENGSAGLTNRQREILKLLHTGKPSKVIAAQLGIGLGTIKSHLHALYSVMQVSSRAEAVVKSQDWLL
jgi:DNA-binding NarL/FixJ family response regulator